MRMRRKHRITIVRRVLTEYPVTRDNYKALVAYTWREELRGKDFTPENIIRYCSSPTGIDRDRRRKEILKDFPRSDEKFDFFREYRDEFGTPVLFKVERS